MTRGRTRLSAGRTTAAPVSFEAFSPFLGSSQPRASASARVKSPTTPANEVSQVPRKGQKGRRTDVYGDVVLLGCRSEGEGVPLPVRDLGAVTAVANVSPKSTEKEEERTHRKMYCPARVVVFSFLIWISQTLLGWRMTLET